MSKKQPDYIKVGDGFVDVTLSRELTTGALKTKQIRMREPTVGDELAVAGKGDIEREINLLANLCDLAPRDMHQVPLRDYKRLQVAVGFFLD